MVDLPKPIAIVVGQFSHRIDLRLLEAVADAGVALLLVGPHDPTFEVEAFSALAGRPNVSWVDQQPYERVDQLLRVSHVGLTPYADSEFNRSSFPLKTLEYLAAGLPVVSSPLPAVEELATDQIVTARAPDEFAAAVQRLLRAPQGEAERARRRAVASDHTWESRASQLLARLERLDVSARRVGR